MQSDKALNLRPKCTFQHGSNTRLVTQKNFAYLGHLLLDATYVTLKLSSRLLANKQPDFRIADAGVDAICARIATIADTP